MNKKEASRLSRVARTPVVRARRDTHARTRRCDKDAWRWRARRVCAREDARRRRAPRTTLFELPTTLGTAVRSGLTRPVRGESSREPSPCGGTVARDAPANAPEKDEDLHRGAELMLLLRGGGVEAARAGNPEPPRRNTRRTSHGAPSPPASSSPADTSSSRVPPNPPRAPRRRRFPVDDSRSANAPRAHRERGRGIFAPPSSPRREKAQAAKRRRRRTETTPGDDHIRAPNTPAETRGEKRRRRERGRGRRGGDRGRGRRRSRSRARRSGRLVSLARRASPRPPLRVRVPRRDPLQTHRSVRVAYMARRPTASPRIVSNRARRRRRTIVAIKLRGWGAELNFPASSYGFDAGFGRDLAEYDADAFIARQNRKGRHARTTSTRRGADQGCRVERRDRGDERASGAATANGVGNEARTASGTRRRRTASGTRRRRTNEAPDMRSSSEDEPSHEREPPLNVSRYCLGNVWDDVRAGVSRVTARGGGVAPRARRRRRKQVPVRGRGQTSVRGRVRG